MVTMGIDHAARTGINKLNVRYVLYEHFKVHRFLDLRLDTAKHMQQLKMHFYRPHPKDGEGNVFSLSTPGGGGGGGYPYPIMLCNISQNALGQPPGGGGYPYPIMLCNISQNVMGQPLGGVGYPARSSQGGYPGRGGTLPGPAGGGYLVGEGVPWWGGTLGVPRSGTPPARSAGGVPWQGVPWWGSTQVRYPPGQVSQGGYPAGGVPRSGQHSEYLLHGGRYASCVHAGGLSCLTSTLATTQIQTAS